MGEIKNRARVVRVSEDRAKAFVELSGVTKFTFNKNNNTFEFRAEDWNRDKESIIHILSKYKHFLIH